MKLKILLGNIVLVLWIIILFLLTPSVNALSTIDGMLLNSTILWVTGDKNSTDDNSTNLNNGTITDGTWVTQTDHFQVGDKATDNRDTAGTIQFPYIPAYKTANFSICLWGNWSTGQTRTIISNRESGVQPWWGLQSNGATDFQFVYQWQGGGVQQVSAAFSYTAYEKTPAQICIVINDTQAGTDTNVWLYISVNGSQVATAQINDGTARPAFQNWGIRLGENSNVATGSETGMYDNIVIRNISMTKDMVNQTYMLGRNGTTMLKYVEAPPISDTTKPIGNGTTNNTSPRINDFVNSSLNASDETALKFANLTINFTTGIVKINYTLSGTDVQISNSTQITDSRGNVLNFSWRFTDTSGNTGQNDTLITVANTPPILTSILGGAKEKEPYNSSLVAYLDFDKWDRHFVNDSTDNNNDGTVFGANRSNGKMGYGLVFDGVDDYVDVDSVVSDVSSDNAGTIELWVKFVAGTEGDIGNIFTISKGDLTNYLQLHIGSANKLGFWIQTTSAVTRKLTTPAYADSWHHYVVTSDGTTTKLFIDGVEPALDTNIDSGNWFNDLSGLAYGRIGGMRYNNQEDTFNGLIDEVRIYNRALTSDEIANHYSQGLGTGNITTQTPLAVSVNVSSDADNDVLYTAVDWYKNGILNATTGHPNNNWSVLFMPFDKRNDASDYSVMNNDGTINGAVFTNDSAIGMGAMSFDGSNDYVELPSSASLDSATGAGQARTVELWFKTTETQNRVVLEKGNNLHFGTQMGYPTAGKIHWKVEFGVTNLIESLNPVNDNLWHHFVGTYDGTVASLFIDGVLQGTNSNQVAPADDGNSVAIGSRLGVGAFNGLIDEVRIYNESLTESEIKQHYQASKLRGLILNQSETKKNEKWNATTTLYDNNLGVSAPINFSFDQIEDTAIVFENFINVSDLTYAKNQTINWSCSDADVPIDSITSNAYFDTVNPPKVQIATDIADFNITTNMTNDGKYFLNATCTSGGKTAYSGIFNISLDVSTPTIDGVPPNGTVYGESSNNITNFSVTLTDNIQLFEGNGTLFSLAGAVLNTTNLTNISTTTFLLNLSLNHSQIPEGYHNLTFWAGDTKNKKRPMPQYKVGKTENNRTLQFNNSQTGLQCNITYGTTNPSENKLLPLNANVSLKMNINYTDDDYYKIVYEVVAPNTGFISATKFACNQQITGVQDNLAGHLLIGTGKDRLSYDAQDLVDSGFTIATKIDTDDNTFFQTIKKSGIIEGAVVSYG